MKINLEEYRRRLTEFLNVTEYVEVYRRGKLVKVLMPPSHYEPTGSRPQPTGSGAKADLNLQVREEPVVDQGLIQCEKCFRSYPSSEIKVEWVGETGEEKRGCVYCKGLKKKFEKRVDLSGVKMNKMGEFCAQVA